MAKLRNTLPDRLRRDRDALIHYLKRREPEHTVDEIALIFRMDKAAVHRVLEKPVEDPLLDNENKTMDPEEVKVEGEEVVAPEAAPEEVAPEGEVAA